MTPGSTRKSGWGRSKTTKKSRLSTAECTSIVEGLKVIYFGKVGLGMLAMHSLISKYCKWMATVISIRRGVSMN